VRAWRPQEKAVYWTPVFPTAVTYPEAVWAGNEPSGELAAFDADQLFVRAVLEGAIQMDQRRHKWKKKKKCRSNVQYGLTEDTWQSLRACRCLCRRSRHHSVIIAKVDAEFS